MGAMISSEVQRTLVKSPPELWAELSDPAVLARHLGELGEIRIVRTEPESTVEWAAENTTGTVSIKPSGWGTRVTLSVTRETADHEPALRSAVEPAPTGTVEPEPLQPEPAGEIGSAEQLEDASDSDTALDSDAALDSDTTLDSDAAPEPEPRRGFFSRLFGRRRRVQQPEPQPPIELAPAELPRVLSENAEPESGDERLDAFAAVRLALETFAATDPFAVASTPEPETTLIEQQAPLVEPFEPLALEQARAGGRAGQADDLSAELLAAEGVAAEQVSAEEVTAVLTAVLDRLGAAHHRPFSRS
jgi:hypothetical protein